MTNSTDSKINESIATALAEESLSEESQKILEELSIEEKQLIRRVYLASIQSAMHGLHHLSGEKNGLIFIDQTPDSETWPNSFGSLGNASLISFGLTRAQYILMKDIHGDNNGE